MENKLKYIFIEKLRKCYTKRNIIFNFIFHEFEVLHRCTHFTLHVYSFTMWIDNHIVTYTTVINGFNYPNKSLRWTLLLAQFHRRETQASSDERVVHSYLASTEFCLDLNVCSLALRPVYKDLSSLLTGPHYRWKEYYTQVLSYTHTKKVWVMLQTATIKQQLHIHTPQNTNTRKSSSGQLLRAGSVSSQKHK